MFTFEKNEILGRGRFGTVYRGTWDNGTEVMPVAVKRVQLIDIEESEQHEENNMKKLRHQNVVRLLHVIDEVEYRCFILELCESSLDKVFLGNTNPEKYKGPKLPHHFTVLLQLTTGLEYIHSSELIHRDVKPQNVLIFVDLTSKAVKLKWADFGLSRSVSERGTYQISKPAGTRSWLAPELLEQIDEWERSGLDWDQVKGKGNVKSDIFALGLVFAYFLNNGIHPYGSTETEIQQNLRTKKQTEIIKLEQRHTYAKDIIVDMLDKDNNNRILSKQVLERLTVEGNKFTECENHLHSFCTDVKTENIIEIQSLLEKGTNVNCLDSQGQTPLLKIANQIFYIQFETVFQVIKLFVQYDELDVNCRQQDESNALHVLCKENNKGLIHIVRLLVEKGIDVQCKDNDGNNALLTLSCYYQNENLIEIIRLLVEKGIDINCKNNDGWNALLTLCCYYQNENLIDIVRLLVEKRIDVNCKENDGWNALLFLCRNYQNENLIDIVRLLVEKGIDVNCKNDDEWNALLFICLYYQNKNLIDIVRLLVEKGIDVNCKTNGGNNALLFLCRNYQNENLIDIIRLLVEKGIDVNCKTNGGNNALLLLCRNYQNENLIDIVRLLVEKGIDVHCKDNDGNNALLFLCRYYQNKNLIDIVRLLVGKGVDVNCKDRFGRTFVMLLREYYHKKNANRIFRLF